MRAQPFHDGHLRLIETMKNNCDDCIVIIGSIQESNTSRNPLDFETRKLLINNIIPDQKVVGLKDLGNPPKWADYVLDFLKPLSPDVYFAGSQQDADWFKNKVENVVSINRDDTKHCTVSASELRDMLKNKNPEWKNFVHHKNHKIIEEKLYGKSLESPNPRA
ncbi:MAG: adenylyltransferase/cytidyltransferase family protein [Lactobacillus sp.]|jgi:cytidyltransferase-like protein|nr:adenylyltransferase/cytidyltransferase family protein [Lactobacillus sp.]